MVIFQSYFSHYQRVVPVLLRHSVNFTKDMDVIRTPNDDKPLGRRDTSYQTNPHVPTTGMTMAFNANIMHVLTKYVNKPCFTMVHA